jgi:hypothetical protein
MTIRIHPLAGTSTELDLALLRAGHETGWWDDHGHPAPWPDDIDEWSPTKTNPITTTPTSTDF